MNFWLVLGMFPGFPYHDLLVFPVKAVWIDTGRCNSWIDPDFCRLVWDIMYVKVTSIQFPNLDEAALMDGATRGTDPGADDHSII